MAVTFHEVWKPSAYDGDLHQRMGTSYATNAFQVIRVALRREMLLALMRLWDKPKKTVRMDEIAKSLRDPTVIDALAADRVARMGLSDAKDQVRFDLSQRATEAVALIDKYSKGGLGYHVFEKLKDLRHERLAHRQIETMAKTVDAADMEVESFYQDMSKVISLLLSLVEGHAYDPAETANVYRQYALFFWASARGEKTAGHPNFRVPLASPE